MAVTFNESGINIQCNKRVSINGYDRIPNKYAEEIKQASGVIERYAKANKANVVFGPVCGVEDVVSIAVIKNKKKSFLFTNGIVKCCEGDIPFLRKVYQKIQALTEGSPKTKLEKLQSETIARLKNIKKIK